MRPYTWGSWVVCALFATASPAARGAVVLDQSFDPTGHITVNAGIAGFNAHQERAETFKVGFTGFLTRVDVYAEVFAPATGSLTMDIRKTVASGAPDPAITPLGALASVSVPATSFPSAPTGRFVTFTLSTPLPVFANTTLAMDLHVSPGGSSFGLLGSTGDPYLPGKAYERETTNHNWVNETGYDLGFQTFVEPVPLPPGLGAGSVVAIGALVARRCQRRLVSLARR
jgi:hypothetical protein